MDAPLTPAATTALLEHPAFLYENVDDFVGTLAPYVAAGVERGETVFVAARGDYLPAVREELGDVGAEAAWVDTNEWYPHPSRRLRASYELVRSRLEDGVPALRLAGEPVWQGPPELVREWQRYESVLNAVFGPYPVSLLCLYDASRLEPGILEGAQCTHPAVRRGGATSPSALFQGPEELLPDWNPPPAPPPTSASGLLLSRLPDLPAARTFVCERAARAGLDADRVADLAVAATEILTNAFLHGGGQARLWVWVEKGSIVCQVADRGSGPSDPLVGYRPPQDGETGRGLWVARQLVDLLLIVPGADGTTVRAVIAA